MIRVFLNQEKTTNTGSETVATRPIFTPNLSSNFPATTTMIEFEWVPGQSHFQKQKSIKNFHSAAKAVGFDDILEISTKSNHLLGRKLSAFNLLYLARDKKIPVECVYQSSKKFECAGPFKDIINLPPIEAKRDIRLQTSGDLIGFVLSGNEWGLTPSTAFYDWVYINAIFQHSELMNELKSFNAFTDIEFNPKKQINCQARSIAVALYLESKGELAEALKSQKSFISIYPKSESAIKQADLFD
jgi:hypothetical protein